MYLAFRGDLHPSESLSSPFMACLHFFTWQCGKVLSALFTWREKRNGNVVYWWSIDSKEGENQHKKPKKAPKESSLIQDYHVCQLYYLNFTRIDMLTFCTERSINAIEGKKMIELLNNKIQNKKQINTAHYASTFKCHVCFLQRSIQVN